MSRRMIPGPAPFLGVVPDTVMADRDQATLFSLIGKTRGLFSDLPNWPDLDRLVRERSEMFRSERGGDAWRDVGGALGPDGRPTLEARSRLGLDIVHELAEGGGRLLWTDAHGRGWAARLLTTSNDGATTYTGLAIERGSSIAVQTPSDGSELRSDRMGADSDGQLMSVHRFSTPRLRLYERAEQVLWAVHQAVLMQRRSLVVLPDVSLGQCVWGGIRHSWPSDWRQELRDVLTSLHFLHVAKLRFDERSWKPRFTAHAVAIPFYEDLTRDHPVATSLDDRCPIHGSASPHGHFLVEIGLGFLGILESFAGPSDQDGVRTYDFQGKPHSDNREAVRDARKAGRIVSVSGPSKLLGPATWSQLTPSQRLVYDGLVAELTRTLAGKKSGRTYRAAIQSGRLVPAPVGDAMIECPALRSVGRYVAFGGNGNRPGRGYRLIGETGKGWLAKCGCEIPDDTTARRRAVRAFLADLQHVACLLGLIVTAVDVHSLEWFGFEELFVMASAASSWKRLDRLHIRVYGPEDYRERLRGHLASRGGFTTIPGLAADPGPKLDAQGTQLDLAARLKLLGITQSRLAGILGISQSFVSQMLRGIRPWPPGMRENAEDFIAGEAAANETQVGSESGVSGQEAHSPRTP